MPFFVSGSSNHNSLCIYPHKEAKIPHLLSLAPSSEQQQQQKNTTAKLPTVASLSLNQQDESDTTQHTDTDQQLPLEQANSTVNTETPLKIFTGSRHGFILTADEDLYAFCDASVLDAVGLKPTQEQKTEPQAQDLHAETRSSLINLRQENPDFFDTVRIKEIACGEDFSIILTQTNELFVCGANQHGQLGLNHQVDIHIPTRNTHEAFMSDSQDLPGNILGNSRAITHVECGNHHTCIVLDHVDMLCFGMNRNFQCGVVTGNTTSDHNITEPRHVLSFYSSQDDSYSKQKERIAQIACGKEHTVVLLEDGTLSVFGGNSVGQCGIGHKKPITSPQRLSFSPSDSSNPGSGAIKLLGCGEYFTVFVTQSDEIFVCGKFLDKIYTAPTRLVFNSRGTDAKLHSIDQLAVGGGFFIFTTNSNTQLWVCGQNDAFQCGTGAQGNIAAPVQLRHDFLSSSAFSHIACGNLFSIFSTFTKEYDIVSHEDLKDQLLAQGHRRTGYLYDLDLVVSGKPFCVCRDLVERRFPLALHLDRTNDVLSADAFSLIIDYIYSDDVHIPRGKDNFELILLELYAFVSQHPESKHTGKLQNILLTHISEVVSETTVVHLLRKVDDIMKGGSAAAADSRRGAGSLSARGPYSARGERSISAEEHSSEALQAFRQHLLAFLKQLIDANRLKDVPNYQALPLEVLQEILIHGSEYKLLAGDNIPQIHSTYIDDLRALCIDQRVGNTRLVLDKSGQHTLRVHRSLLAARCPRLGEIFHEHFQKNNDIIVFIEQYLDDESMIHVFPQFVEFLYTGEITISPRNAHPLIRIWESMGMPMDHLVSIRCQEMSVNTLTLDNVLPLYKSLLSRRRRSTKNGQRKSEALGVLEAECKKLCLRHWRDLHSRLGGDMLTYFVDARVYFDLNCEYLGVKLREGSDSDQTQV